MKAKLLHLDPNDDPASARDRIEWAQAPRVALVMPAELVWQSVDYARLQHAAIGLGVELGIVHPLRSQRAVAEEVGLRAFPTPEAAMRQAWPTASRSLPARLSLPRRFVPNTLSRFFPARKPLAAGLKGLLTLFALFVMLGGAAVLSLEARVTLAVPISLISETLPFTLDTRSDRVNLNERIIPARRLDVVVEGQLSTPASGRKDIPRFKARGRVVFFNLLTTPYTVLTNTVLRTTATSTPQRFVTLSAVEVPPGGRAEAEVEALEPGVQGNVGALQINLVEGIAAVAVRVANPEPLKGGGDVTVRTVVKEDYKRLEQALRGQLLEKALEQMRQERDVVANGWIILPETLFVADVQEATFNRFLTEQADSVTLTMRLQVTGLAIDPADLQQVGRALLADRTPPGFRLLALNPTRSEAVEQTADNRVQIRLVMQGVVGPAVDQALVRRTVRGKSIEEAASLLERSYPLRRPPSIYVRPEWLYRLLGRLPLATHRIQIQVDLEPS